MGVRIAVAALAVAVCAGAAVKLIGNGEGHRSHRATKGAGRAVAVDTEAAQAFPEPSSSHPRKLAKDPAEAASQAAASTESGVSPGAPSDAEVRRELHQLQRYKRRERYGGTISGGGRHALAEAPFGAPALISDVVSGGNEIATFPYRLGGGHGSFIDNAYDCSGSVSYALAAADMLRKPETSGQLMKWGAAGRGHWLTVWANPGHVFMTVGGLRFDTSGRAGPRGSRWQPLRRSAGGFVARHWPGL